MVKQDPQNWRKLPLVQLLSPEGQPDLIQVFVHDGGLKTALYPAELLWVTITSYNNHIFTGVLLDNPKHITSIRQGDAFKFIQAKGFRYPIMVSDRYLMERKEWFIKPCDNCGFSELLDVPSEIIAKPLPGQDDIEAFTTFCPMCGGVQFVGKEEAFYQNELGDYILKKPV